MQGLCKTSFGLREKPEGVEYDAHVEQNKKIVTLLKKGLLHASSISVKRAAWAWSWAV